MSKEFKGPLFIVGMSRSGTKLLRDILNNGSEIGIPSFESHFLPYLVQAFQDVSFPLTGKDATHLKKLVKSSIFYNDIQREEGENFRDLNFKRLAQQDSIQDSIEYMMSILGNQENIQSTKIWGDKTPNNLVHMSTLKSAFPEARFIHIIRDPRERALSAKKAWRASLVMSAERWNNGVGEAIKQGSYLETSYTQTTYEGLVANPEREIKRLCDFIGIEYSDSMLQLSRPAENYDTASGATAAAQTVIKGNVEKYKRWLTETEIAQIEQLCGGLMESLGYVLYAESSENKSISSFKLTLLKIRDMVMTVRFHIQRWGVLGGLHYLWWRRKVTKI